MKAGLLEEMINNGNIKVRGGAIVIENEVQPRVFHLSVQSWDRLLDVHLGAVV